MKPQIIFGKIIKTLVFVFLVSLLLILYAFVKPNSSVFVGLDVSIQTPKSLVIYNSGDPNIQDVVVPDMPSIIDEDFVIDYKVPNLIDIFTYKENTDLSLIIKPKFFCYQEYCKNKERVKIKVYDKNDKLILQSDEELKVNFNINEQFFEKNKIVIKSYYNLEKIIQINWIDHDNFNDLKSDFQYSNILEHAPSFIYASPNTERSLPTHVTLYNKSSFDVKNIVVGCSYELIYNPGTTDLYSQWEDRNFIIDTVLPKYSSSTYVYPFYREENSPVSIFSWGCKVKKAVPVLDSQSNPE